ncbi:ATP-binding response regulator [Roseateles aquatilis]|nr:HAMP domain-containing sensor histidine kinase [Roseateles aquatilis]
MRMDSPDRARGDVGRAGRAAGDAVGWLVAVVLFLALLWARPALAIEIRQAERLKDGEAVAQTVALPDTWAGPASGALRGARYRLRFHLDQPPGDTLWGLRIDRLASVHRIYLNGRLVHEQGGHGSARLRLLPAYLPLAPTLFRRGDNELRLELTFSTRAGLSPVEIGPDTDLRPRYESDRGWDTRWPQHLNIAGAALAACMLLLWWRRPQERATGLFGALWLIASMRNFDYFIAASPFSSGLSDWLYYSAQCGTVALLGLFSIELAGRPRPRLRRVYALALPGLPLLGAVAAAVGLFAPVRQVVYPLLIVMGVGALLLMARLLRGQRGLALAMLCLGVGALVLSGAHDYAFLRSWLPVTDFFWMAYTAPFALAGYAGMLLNRLVRGLERAEELSLMLERRVAERTIELADANAAKSRFLAAASHDLRQPVAAIGLLAGLVRERVAAMGGPALALMDKLSQAVLALEDLLRGLMDLSRLDAGNAAPTPRPVALQPLFDAIALHEQPHAQARGLRLRLRPTDAVVASDPVLLDQMLRNLVGNALRYTSRGGVLVGVRRRGSRWLLQVWDSGRGIAPADQRQVFEEFVQLDNPQRDRNQGLGLGLAIVRRSAALMGHALGLASRPGRGSCFWIELPSAPADARPAAAVEPAAAPLQGRAVWLLEDDGALRDALVERLVAWGAEVVPMASLTDLRAALADIDVDADPSAPPAAPVLLSDHRLPDGDSVQALALFGARFDSTAVVMTGDVGPRLAGLFADYAARGVPVLHKPFDADTLLRLLSTPPPSRRSGPLSTPHETRAPA